MRRQPWSGCWRSKPGTDVDYVPHVVAWNLTRRCNLECAHCYIAAGPHESAATELDTAACLEIVDQLLAVNPAPLLILSGGEPLLRQDLAEIAHYAAANGATVVVGTNGTLLTDGRIAALKQAGVQGVAVSVDSLRPSYHDNFRHGRGALADVQVALGRLSAARLDFIVQTAVTKGNRPELERLVAWSAEQGAVCFNCYFLVSTGRGASLNDLAPVDYEAVLADLARWHAVLPHHPRRQADPVPIPAGGGGRPARAELRRHLALGAAVPAAARGTARRQVRRMRVPRAVRRLPRARLRPDGRRARGRSVVHL